MLALDQELADLQHKASVRSELPLSIRRFQQFIGASDPISAMTSAAASVLVSADHDLTSPARVSATALCTACDLSLEGAPRRRRGAGSRLASESGHTGALRLSTQGSRIVLPQGLDVTTGRVAVGHEIGHFLIHRRGNTIDSITARLPTSPEEEALAEYAGRILLMPGGYGHATAACNVAIACLERARQADVTLHAATARLGDPDSQLSAQVRGVILWRINGRVAVGEPTAMRLAPHWHLCQQAFVPVHRCHAGRGSLVGELGALDDTPGAASRVERVEIGSFRGTFRVDAVAWGSTRRGSRTVLSVFLEA